MWTIYLERAGFDTITFARITGLTDKAAVYVDDVGERYVNNPTHLASKCHSDPILVLKYQPLAGQVYTYVAFWWMDVTDGWAAGLLDGCLDGWMDRGMD